MLLSIERRGMGRVGLMHPYFSRILRRSCEEAHLSRLVHDIKPIRAPVCLGWGGPRNQVTIDKQVELVRNNIKFLTALRAGPHLAGV